MMGHHVTLPTGLRVRCIEAGDPSRPLLVLLHGYPTDARLWRGCMGLLAKTYRVIAPDLPGHGRTDGQPHVEHDLDYYVAWMEMLYDAFGLERPHLVAHDLGGMVALGFAGRHPEQVDRFVIMNTASYANWPWQMTLGLKMMALAPLRRLALNRRFFRWMLWRFTTGRRDVAERLATVFDPSWIATRDTFSLRTRQGLPETRTRQPRRHEAATSLDLRAHAAELVRELGRKQNQAIRFNYCHVPENPISRFASRLPVTGNHVRGGTLAPPVGPSYRTLDRGGLLGGGRSSTTATHSPELSIGPLTSERRPHWEDAMPDG